jgi:hypothetical protein
MNITSLNEAQAKDLLRRVASVVARSGANRETGEPLDYEWSDGMEAVYCCFASVGIKIK